MIISKRWIYLFSETNNINKSKLNGISSFPFRRRLKRVSALAVSYAPKSFIKSTNKFYKAHHFFRKVPELYASKTVRVYKNFFKLSRILKRRRKRKLLTVRFDKKQIRMTMFRKRFKLSVINTFKNEFLINRQIKQKALRILLFKYLTFFRNYYLRCKNKKRLWFFIHIFANKVDNFLKKNFFSESTHSWLSVYYLQYFWGQKKLQFFFNRELDSARRLVWANISGFLDGIKNSNILIKYFTNPSLGRAIRNHYLNAKINNTLSPRHFRDKFLRDGGDSEKLRHIGPFFKYKTSFKFGRNAKTGFWRSFIKKILTTMKYRLNSKYYKTKKISEYVSEDTYKRLIEKRKHFVKEKTKEVQYVRRKLFFGGSRWFRHNMKQQLILMKKALKTMPSIEEKLYTKKLISGPNIQNPYSENNEIQFKDSLENVRKKSENERTEKLKKLPFFLRNRSIYYFYTADENYRIWKEKKDLQEKKRELERLKALRKEKKKKKIRGGRKKKKDWELRRTVIMEDRKVANAKKSRKQKRAEFIARNLFRIFKKGSGEEPFTNKDVINEIMHKVKQKGGKKAMRNQTFVENIIEQQRIAATNEFADWKSWFAIPPFSSPNFPPTSASEQIKSEEETILGQLETSRNPHKHLDEVDINIKSGWNPLFINPFFKEGPQSKGVTEQVKLEKEIPLKKQQIQEKQKANEEYLKTPSAVSVNNELSEKSKRTKLLREFLPSWMFSSQIDSNPLTNMLSNIKREDLNEKAKEAFFDRLETSRNFDRNINLLESRFKQEKPWVRYQFFVDNPSSKTLSYKLIAENTPKPNSQPIPKNTPKPNPQPISKNTSKSNFQPKLLEKNSKKNSRPKFLGSTWDQSWIDSQNILDKQPWWIRETIKTANKRAERSLNKPLSNNPSVKISSKQQDKSLKNSSTNLSPKTSTKIVSNTLNVASSFLTKSTKKYSVRKHQYNKSKSNFKFRSKRKFNRFKYIPNIKLPFKSKYKYKREHEIKDFYWGPYNIAPSAVSATAKIINPPPRLNKKSKKKLKLKRKRKQRRITLFRRSKRTKRILKVSKKVVNKLSLLNSTLRRTRKVWKKSTLRSVIRFVKNRNKKKYSRVKKVLNRRKALKSGWKYPKRKKKKRRKRWKWYPFEFKHLFFNKERRRFGFKLKSIEHPLIFEHNLRRLIKYNFYKKPRKQRRSWKLEFRFLKLRSKVQKFYFNYYFNTILKLSKRNKRAYRMYLRSGFRLLTKDIYFIQEIIKFRERLRKRLWHRFRSTWRKKKKDIWFRRKKNRLRRKILKGKSSFRNRLQIKFVPRKKININSNIACLKFFTKLSKKFFKYQIYRNNISLKDFLNKHLVLNTSKILPKTLNPRYYLFFKKKRSNYYFTVVNQVGEVIFYKSCGSYLTRIKKRRNKKMRSSYYNTKYIPKIISGALFAKRIRTIHTLFKPTSLPFWAIKKLYRSFRHFGIKILRVSYIPSYSHGLSQKMRKKRRI